MVKSTGAHGNSVGSNFSRIICDNSLFSAEISHFSQNRKIKRKNSSINHLRSISLVTLHSHNL